MTELQVSKSILAKLLAAENITVSHQATKTAYFDLKTRTLVCPVWKDMDGDLYDLLMGHEVGHALETPAEGWHNALETKDGSKVDMKFKSFLNVIEDARIEKKVKRRFPGLAKSFAAAYKQLFESNFFGVKNIDVNKLNLIDRINLKFKLGAHIHVPFNDFEREIIKEVDNAETWEQVEDIARRVYAYVKEKEQDKIQTQTDLQQEQKLEKQKDQEEMDEMLPEEDGQDPEDSDDFGDVDEAGDSDSEDYDDEESNDYNEEDESETNSESDGAEENQNDGNPESVTDRIFRKREEELVNESGKVGMFYLPEANLDRIIVKNTDVMDALESYIRGQVTNSYGVYGSKYAPTKFTYEQIAAKCVRKFTTRNKKFIAHILKEFDMRKKATAYARTQTARTGELDMNVLHKYKFSNDLFKKISIIPKGKNHGMILFLDMSGSMCSIFRNTIEQLLVLVSFCKTANIPFEVYGFSDDRRGPHQAINKREATEAWNFDYKVDVIPPFNTFHLQHLIGSSLSPANYRRSFNNLAIVVNEFYRGGYYDRADDCDHGSFDTNWNSGGFGLNGTPFIETLLASREIITTFRKDHNLDITNVIYLTDGEGNGSLSLPQDCGISFWKNDSVIYFVDKKTKKKIRVKRGQDQQAAVTELVRQVTGCKHIGYYLGNTHDIRYALSAIRHSSERGDLKYNQVDIDNMKKSLKENNFFACSNLGYDRYFYMTSSPKNIEEEKIEIDASMTKSKMANAFKKTQISKRSARVLVSKFAEEIAVAI